MTQKTCLWVCLGVFLVRVNGDEKIPLGDGQHHSMDLIKKRKLA